MSTHILSLGIPVGEFHLGNTSEYVLRAATKLGVNAEILNHEQFVQSFLNDRFDFYLGVDSGKPIDFTDPRLSSLTRVGYWFIDYRHNKDRLTRQPTDSSNAKALSDKGGWSFQSQSEDVADALARGVANVSWLPLAADPDVWSDKPVVAKDYDIGFIGNVWDKNRAAALELLLNQPWLKVAFKGHGAAWKEEGAAILRRCRVGFNINSWFGEPHAYDVNMRAFETLSCGIPLITNDVAALSSIFGTNAGFLKSYSSLNELLPTVRAALQSAEFLSSGAQGRAFILAKATYEIRLIEALDRLRLNSVG